MRRSLPFVLVVALVACTRAPIATAPVAPTQPPPPPLTADARRELEHCVGDGIACQMASTMAPLATLERACVDEVPGACVTWTVARMHRPAVYGERTALVRELERWCLIGEDAACGLMKEYRRTEPLEYFTLTGPFGKPPGNPKRYTIAIDETKDHRYRRKQACRESDDPLACDPLPGNRVNASSNPDEFELNLAQRCEEAHLAACVRLPLEADDYGRPRINLNLASKHACEGGLHVFCEDVRADADDGVTEAWVAAKKAEVIGLCDAGASAMSCSAWMDSRTDKARCDAIHGVCERFACPLPLVAMLLRCERDVAPWPAGDAVLARAHLAMDEVACLEGDGAACTSAAAAHNSGVPGIAADPVSGHAFAELACRIHSQPSACALVKTLGPATTVGPVPPPRRVVVAPLVTKGVTATPATVEQVRKVLDAQLARFTTAEKVTIVPAAEVLAARDWANGDPCGIACVRTLDRLFQPIAVLVPVMKSERGGHLVEVKMFRTTPADFSATFTAGSENEERVAPDLESRLAESFARRDLVPAPPKPVRSGPPPRLEAARQAGVAQSALREFLPELHRIASPGDKDDWLKAFTERLEVPRGNRYALFFDASLPVEDRSLAFLPVRPERLGGIGADVFVHPKGGVPDTAAATKCPISQGIVGHRGRSGPRYSWDDEPEEAKQPAAPEFEGASDTDYLILAAANLDDDETLDCWTIASYDRRLPSGRYVSSYDAFHEQADVPETDLKAVRDALEGTGAVPAVAAVLGARTTVFPETLAPVKAALERMGSPPPDMATLCDEFRYERLAPDRLRIGCAALGVEEEIVADWSANGLVVTVDGRRVVELLPAMLEMALKRLEAGPEPKPEQVPAPTMLHHVRD